EYALYSSYTCAMNMITVRRYGTMILCGSMDALRVVNHQRMNPPANSGTYARANGRTNRYSMRNQAATNKEICRIGRVRTSNFPIPSADHADDHGRSS